MPRLRQVRTKEEAEKVPLEQEVQVIIPPEGEVEVTAGSTGAEIREPEKKPAVEQEEHPDTIALKKRLEDLTKAEQSSRDREAALLRERDEARRLHEEATQRGEQSREEADEARYVAILNALDAAESEAQSANGAFERAVSEGDYKAQAEANRRLAKAEAAISRHEEAKAAYEEAKKTKEARKPETRTVSSDPFEEAIKQLPDVAKTWLRAHPEYITDTNKNEDIRYFDMTARRQGIRPYTPEYFESIEIQAGLRQAPQGDEEDEEVAEPPKPRRQQAVTSAPPTREATSLATGKAITSKVTLNPEQRDIARKLGISEIEYAKQLIKMREAKSNGRYTEG